MKMRRAPSRTAYSLPEPQRNVVGQVDNVVMILHGTGNGPPTSRDTRGHGSYVWAALWKNRLAELLATGP